MKKKVGTINNVSIMFYVLSSISLLIIPFINQDSGLNTLAYCTAGVFWSGLIIGSVLQIIASFMGKKLTKKKTYKARRLLIPIAVFSILLILILCIGKQSVMLLSIDLALLLMSIELYIFLRRRYEL